MFMSLRADLRPQELLASVAAPSDRKLLLFCAACLSADWMDEEWLQLIYSRVDEVLSKEKHISALLGCFGAINGSPTPIEFAEWVVRPLETPYPSHQYQSRLLFEVFGNSLRHVEFDPRWQTSDVVGLARAIYDDRAFDSMPILADALMDAGCENDQIISHCRANGPHVRGCWVVDMILGKE